MYNHIRTTLHPPGLFFSITSLSLFILFKCLDSHMPTADDPYVLVFLKKCCYPWFKYMFVGECFEVIKKIDDLAKFCNECV